MISSTLPVPRAAVASICWAKRARCLRAGALSKSIAHFVLLELVGIGGFGSVWKARDTELDRIVALKIPRSRHADLGDQEQFVREARVAAQLRHPNIVTVYEVGRHDGIIYIVSDFIQGSRLPISLPPSGPTAREAAELCATVADALDHAHQRGVVHRDLKPSNILIDGQRRPHVVDFGLAKRETAEITITIEGRVLGTPGIYVSGAGARRGACGRWADRCLFARRHSVSAFDRRTPLPRQQADVAAPGVVEEPRPPRALNDRLPRDLDTITMMAMAKEPARRYATARAMADDLRRYLDGRVIVARPIGRVETAWRWMRRNPLTATLSTLTAARVDSDHARLRSGLRTTRRALDGETIARQEAEERRNEAQRALAAEEIQRQETNRERQRAENNFHRARRAVDEYMTLVSENRLLDEPGMQELRSDLLQGAVRYYQEFLKDRSDDPQIKAEVASAYLRLSQLQLILAQNDESLVSLRRALDLVEQVIDSGLDVTKQASWIAGLFRGPRYNRRASAWPSNMLVALALITRGSQIWEKLVAQAPEVAGFRQDLAGFYFYLGLASYAMKKTENGIRQMAAAEQLLRTLRDQHPDSLIYREDWAIAVATLAEMHEVSLKPDVAMEIYEDCAIRSGPITT